jgi:hypothetical protein
MTLMFIRTMAPAPVKSEPNIFTDDFDYTSKQLVEHVIDGQASSFGDRELMFISH